MCIRDRLYYGIPSYRLPRERLDSDINAILSTGVEVRLNSPVGEGEGKISINDLREQYDAVYISIGAHTDKKVGLPGEDAKGVISAVEMLGTLADGGTIDLKGKRVCVIGGGNVAMDVTRSAIRLGASTVRTCLLYTSLWGPLGGFCGLVIGCGYNTLQGAV